MRRRPLRKGQGKPWVPPGDGTGSVGPRPAGRVPSPRWPPQADLLQRKVEENEQLRLELQMVETERVRLSLLEEKLADVLQLLQRLRDLNVSRRALGKILLNTLEACKEPTPEGRSGPSATLDALHQALAGCELLRREPSAPASTAPAPANPLLISC